MLLLYSILVLYVNSAVSGIIKAPGMQRKVLRETVTFQWSVTGSISNYSVYSQASGTLNKINANYTMDSQTGVVTLIIRNIQLSDAGNYSLSVTIGTTVQIDTGALLFVYGYSQSFVNQTSDGIKQLPSTEGDKVELACIMTSTSLPAEYRTKMYYWWYLSWLGTTLQNISSGPAISSYGDLVPGYSIKDDGRTLVIASASYRDTQFIYCYGQEQWSPYTSSAVFYLPLKYRPYISSRIPSSRKFNAIIGNNVSLSVYFQAANPAVTSVTNWTFVNTAGNIQDLPPGSSYSISYSPYYLSFIFTSEAFYGNYSITFSNIIGSTTETFQVLRPGPPDAPSDVRAYFVSHYLIAITWNCMWFNGRQQKIFLQLKAPGDDKIIDSWNTTVDTTCYNSTYAPTAFRNGIQPETDYEVSAWSSNDLGSSVIIKLKVKTSKIFKFFVSPKDISFNGNQAIVNNFSATDGEIAQLRVTCCLELTGVCVDYYFNNVTGNFNQVTIDNNLPTGNVYIFDFRVYGGKPARTVYYLTMVNGVRVSRIDEPNDPTDVEKANPLLIPVIVLGVLFGIAVLALIGCFIAFLVCKCRQNIQPNNTQQTKQPKTNPNARAPHSTTKRTNEAYEEDEDTYETVDGIASNNATNYTPLEVQRYT